MGFECKPFMTFIQELLGFECRPFIYKDNIGF